MDSAGSWRRGGKANPASSFDNVYKNQSFNASPRHVHASPRHVHAGRSLFDRVDEYESNNAAARAQEAKQRVTELRAFRHNLLADEVKAYLTAHCDGFTNIVQISNDHHERFSSSRLREEAANLKRRKMSAGAKRKSGFRMPQTQSEFHATVLFWKFELREKLSKFEKISFLDIGFAPGALTLKVMNTFGESISHARGMTLPEKLARFDNCPNDVEESEAFYSGTPCAHKLRKHEIFSAEFKNICDELKSDEPIERQYNVLLATADARTIPNVKLQSMLDFEAGFEYVVNRQRTQQAELSYGLSRLQAGGTMLMGFYFDAHDPLCWEMLIVLIRCFEDVSCFKSATLRSNTNVCDLLCEGFQPESWEAGGLSHSIEELAHREQIRYGNSCFIFKKTPLLSLIRQNRDKLFRIVEPIIRVKSTALQDEMNGKRLPCFRPKAYGKCTQQACRRAHTNGELSEACRAELESANVELFPAHPQEHGANGGDI